MAGLSLRRSRRGSGTTRAAGGVSGIDVIVTRWYPFKMFYCVYYTSKNGDVKEHSMHLDLQLADAFIQSDLR